MPRRLPSLSAVRAFEAAARLSSFTVAAAEIGTTQSGVSRLVRVLEAQVGHALFARANRRVELTPAGRALAPALTAALDGMAGAFEALADRARQVISITAVPSLNPGWLIPRLAAFQEAHPAIELRLDVSHGLVDLAQAGVDVALRSGDGDWPGLVAHRLAALTLSPLCSPAFVARHGPFRTPRDLLAAPLIERTDPAWTRWFAAAGVAEADPGGGPALRLRTRNLFSEAARASRGAALLMPSLYGADLVEGRLVQPFDVVLDMRRTAYWFCCLEAQRASRPIRLLRQWLTREFRGA